MPELCAPICRPDQLAVVKEANDIAGYVTAQAAAETGLAEGTPVITGTDDLALRPSAPAWWNRAK